MRNISKKGLEFLKDIEEFRDKPYDDQTGKEIDEWCPGATLGYGHLITLNEWENVVMLPEHAEKRKNGISKKLGTQILKRDLQRFELTVYAELGDIAQNEFDALVILSFNIGTDAFKKSSVLKILKGQNAAYKSLKNAWLAWNKSQGKVMQGLVNRRNAEWNMYSKGVYETW